MNELTPDQQALVERLFERALDLPLEQRAAVLEREPADPMVRAEVQSLLDARPAAEELINDPIADSGLVADALLASPPSHVTTTPDPDPSEIGPYRVLSKLGEGGMGTVYLAEQTEPLRRRVAVKLVKLGMDTRSVLRRFEAERQALALMNHPNVARALDAGATAQGRPYFVMEWVDGARITAFCDEDRLDTHQRLGVFLQACAGVQHAHQKGVIHRDIKPSNVLVSQDNGLPVTKVIDFGVAKATERRLTAETLSTEQGALIGTPAYMSPEQADPTTADIDTRSDVYSLGVLLYELLVGTPPLDAGSSAAGGFDDVRRMIREQDPVRPSTRLSSLGDAADTTARNRRTDPSTLRRQLRGDLDWVVMKCLAKDRDLRYAAVAELIDDIDRYVRHQPVTAGPPGASYRMRKFLRRNRAAVSSALAVLAVLIAGLISTGVFAVRESRQRAAAQEQAETAQAVNTFLGEMLASVDPKQAQGRDVGVLRDILDEAAAKVESELSGQPGVESAVRRTIGRTHMNLGLYAEAEPHLERALEIERARDDGSQVDLATALYLLGILRDYQGRYAAGESLLEEAVALRRDVLGPGDPHLAAALNRLGIVLLNLGRLDEARARIEEAVAILEGIHGPGAPEAVFVLGTLAGYHAKRGAFAESEVLYREVLSAFEDRPDDPDTIALSHNLAHTIERQGRFDEAEQLYRQVLEGRHRVYGQEHPATLKTNNALAALLERQNRHQESEALHREVLAVRRSTLGDVHPDVHNSLHNLGSVLLAQHKFDECIAVSREAVALSREIYGPKHPLFAISLGQLGFALRDTRDAGHYAESEQLLLESLAILEATLPEHHPFTKNTLRGLRQLYEEDIMNDPAKLEEIESRLEAIDEDVGHAP